MAAPYHTIMSLFVASTILITGCSRDSSDPEQSSEASFPESSHYEKLKGLDWIIGDWKDDQPDIDFTITYKWILNKNFIAQEFLLKSEGQPDLKGQQLIGWDPVAERMHSWTFDSDGAIGEGSWFEDNGSWYANIAFTLGDGRKGAATHIYKKIDSSTYLFSSENRDIDGEILPNIGPFKVVKK